MNPIDTIKAGYSLYNSNFEYIGKSGEFHIPNCDGTVKWVQLLDNPEYSWVYGDLSQSYNRGFIVKNCRLTSNKFKKPRKN